MEHFYFLVKIFLANQSTNIDVLHVTSTVFVLKQKHFPSVAHNW